MNQWKKNLDYHKANITNFKMTFNSEELSELIKLAQEQHNLSVSEEETEFWSNIYLKLRTLNHDS